MALVNEIQVARYNAILHKLLAMKEGAPAPVLMPEVMAALVLESDRPEWSFLAGEHLAFGQGRRAGPGAGLFSYVGLQNPANSGVLVIVESTSVSNLEATTRFQLRIAVNVEEVLTPTSSGKAWRDLRGASVQGSESLGIVADIRGTGTASGSPAGGATTVFLTTDANEVRVYQGPPIVLVPNSFLFWSNQVADSATYANFAWRERSFEPSETR